MKYRNLILTTLLAGSLATVGFVSISHAGPQCGDRHGMHGQHTGYVEGHRDPLQRLMRHVDLTDAQQSEIKAILDTSRTDTKNLSQQLRDSRKAMYNLVTGTNYNPERVRDLADEQAKLNAELTVARIDTMHRTLQVLTPEQQAELAKLREQRMTRKKAWLEDHKSD